MKRNTSAFKQRFEAWKNGEPVYENGRVLPRFLNGKDGILDKLRIEADYESFLSTLPDNQQPTLSYNTRRAWELYGRPKNVGEAMAKGLYSYGDDGLLHANSIGYNQDTGSYEFLKSNVHPTHWMELNSYNNNRNFKSQFEYKRSLNPYIGDKYIPRKKLKMLRGGTDGFSDDNNTDNYGFYWSAVPTFINTTNTNNTQNLLQQTILTLESLEPVKRAIRAGLVKSTALRVLEHTVRRAPVDGYINNGYDKELAWYGLSNALGQMTNITDAGRYTPQFGELMGLLYELMAQVGVGAMLPASVAGFGNPILDAAAISAFGAHGMNHIVNDGIDGLEDGIVTGLEILPLYNTTKALYKPISNAIGSAYNNITHATNSIKNNIAGLIFKTSKLKKPSPTDKIINFINKPELDMMREIEQTKQVPIAYNSKSVLNLIKQGVDVERLTPEDLNIIFLKYKNLVASDPHVYGRRGFVSDDRSVLIFDPTILTEKRIGYENNITDRIKPIGSIRIDHNAIGSQNRTAEALGLVKIPYSKYLDERTIEPHMIRNYLLNISTDDVTGLAVNNKHIGLDLYNVALDNYLKDGGFGLVSGRWLLNPEATGRTITNNNFNRIVFKNAGVKQNPKVASGDVSIITKPKTSIIPYKTSYKFNINDLDILGNLHIDWTRR